MSIPLSVVPVVGLPEVTEGDRLGELMAGAARLEPGDVLVVSQKVVSKAEGRVRRLAEVEPRSQARELASRLDKDPALVQAVLDESRSVIRAQEGVLITETHSGWICANAGIDASNVPEEGIVTLLPLDPDASAQRIRSEIRGATGNAPAVVISDSFGRPWRRGQVDVAIGCAGLSPLDDWRGRRDRSGRELTATLIALADELAAAADLVRDKDAGVAAAIVRGFGERVSDDDDGPGAASIQRPSEDDLFR
ncbi:MAG TPA: coenzyme F420-0:L-glutamate ligase [Solirubrobacterales bacterium]|jgi:coenzyme F420-0:L-glutamate ligase/coenzyme F420-1:gamma-L-glutamate ligase|nr:coenzyme F420-0:L-glutamate ligase [Solirubrobacterales bacterium]